MINIFNNKGKLEPAALKKRGKANLVDLLIFVFILLIVTNINNIDSL